jgi:prephenate dehydrogenase
VLGMGLIGGSVLRASVAVGRPAWGATESDEDRRSAAEQGFDVEPTVLDAVRRAAAADALVVVATPLPAVEAVLRVIAAQAPHCRLTDVVSVKRPVSALVRRIVPRARYVGGHPMAGTSASGWAAGSASLFHGAAWVVATDDAQDVDLWSDVARLALDCGAHVVPTTTDEHDEAVGRVSHLPHVLAAVLAAVGADGGPLALALAAGSFRDGTRVAGTRPELVRAMCEGNRDGLLAAVNDALGKLGAARGALASTGSLAATTNAGHHGRQAFDQVESANRDKVVVRLAGPGALAELAELGRRGGRVVGLDNGTALAEVPHLG